MNRLQVRNIEYSYGQKPVLRGLSLDLERERLLLIGANGAGKSTLLKVIAGLFTPQRGEITGLGHDLLKLSLYQRVQLGISYLAQTRNIVPGLSVLDNLLLGGYGLNREEARERADQTLAIFPFLRDKLNRRAGNLSGGERQALAISMVLMKRPKILLLDEPSAGLSPKAARQIISHLLEIQEMFAIETLCMVEHKLKLALPWAERVVILGQGKLIHTDEHPSVYLDNPERLEYFFFQDRTDQSR